MYRTAGRLDGDPPLGDQFDAFLQLFGGVCESQAQRTAAPLLLAQFLQLFRAVFAAGLVDICADNAGRMEEAEFFSAEYTDIIICHSNLLFT